MDGRLNLTYGFMLLGFSDLHYNPTAMFSIILVVYTVTWAGNLLLLLSIYFSPGLHTPMYFFLGNLSVVDISMSTVNVPRLLHSLIHGMTHVSFSACLLQFFFFFYFGTAEIILLAVMSIDRYLAICRPLRYNSIMVRKVRVMLIAVCWVTAFFHSFLYAFTMSQLSYCEDRLIRHFFCDLTPLLKLSCSTSTFPQLLLYCEGSMLVCIPFLSILTSYIFIARTIAKLKTTTSRRKAFSSCSSHLMVVCLFYCTDIAIYFRPSSNYSSHYDRWVSMGYTVLTPMMNPFIYSLRNQDVRKAIGKLFV
ncbi:olfactory receptor 1f45-like [Gastrophryne carolinensis]